MLRGKALRDWARELAAARLRSGNVDQLIAEAYLQGATDALRDETDRHRADIEQRRKPR